MAADKPKPSHSVDEDALKAQELADEENIQKLLSQGPESGGGLGINFDDDTPFDQTNKADDAQDFEDISDDDLPDEEEAAGGTSLSLPGLTDDGGTSNDTDDLFGEGGASSPLDPVPGPSSPAPRVHDPEAADSLHHLPDFRDINFDPEPGYEAANQDPDIPAPAETVEDLVKQTWPSWKKGVILKWNELLPPKKARWIEKKPARKPKTLIATKLSLDMAPDQEKLFRVPGPAASTRKQRLTETESRGLVWCSLDDTPDEADAEDFNLDQESDSETVAGFTLQDIEMVCDDWVSRIEQAQLDSARALEAAAAADSHKRGHDDDEWEAMFLDAADAPPPRKKARPPIPTGLPQIPRFTAPSFDSFEQATKRAAKRVRLDMNDPYLLFEEIESQRGPKRQRLDQKLTRMSTGRFGRDVTQRFNLSNDDAYEALKENHQHKVRATLGNLAVEHSAPALKLAWPFYKVKIDIRKEGYHRPLFKFGKYERQMITFSKLNHFKRKQMKGKANEVFRTTKDLGITDNSTAVLFEYCERTPPVLSNFGMGNRVINYYRKKKVEDEEVPPKLDIGESHVLLPEDRSPFAIFGEVDAGQAMPTLHNQMYRAPIFKHAPRPTDFLCVRSSTGVEGSQYFLHKIDHLYVVGQTFPSVEVPGPHSRKVTNASKNRIKMISFRMMRKDPNHLVNLTEVTRHIAESTDAQNRQKLKEFLSYARGENAKGEKGLWGLKAGEILLDEPSIRAMIKPEDVCLIDGMQLGMQMLEDAGFDPSNVILEGDDVEEDEEEDGDRPTVKGSKKGGGEKNDERLADKMAPWKTSKAFIDACAGKAMLKLHGQGDPTGHGLGFSFMRTSMKGGYIETVQKGGSHTTANDAMAAHPDAMRKAYNGHAYNVKEQEAMYRRGIREIWDKQKASLEDQTEQDDHLVVPPPADEDDRFNVQAAQTPAHIDEGVSQITGLTTSTSRMHRKKLRITRQYQISETEYETRSVIVDDPVVIDRYIKRRKEEQDGLNPYEVPKQGQVDDESSRRHLVEYEFPIDPAEPPNVTYSRINKELERLNRNKQRRIGREQQKGLHKAAVSARDGGSPDADRATTGTTRKCANCGMVGHIKTNKKLCPMLNGTMKTDNGIAEHGGFGVYTAPANNAGSPNQ